MFLKYSKKQHTFILKYLIKCYSTSLHNAPNVKVSKAMFRSHLFQSCCQIVHFRERFQSYSSGKTGTTRIPFDGVGNVDGQMTEQDFGDYVKEICKIPGMGQRALVIQPDIKAGRRKIVMTTKELKLEETCALVRTLPNWIVVEKKIVRTSFEESKKVFGSGNYEKLLKEIPAKRSISVVVIGIDRLRSSQVKALQDAWGLPVFDRYTIILQIFKNHANSEEAKLQVALAEIPYIKFRLSLIHSGNEDGIHIFGGRQMTREKRNELIKVREAKLKRELDKLHKKRRNLRLNRKESSEPTVAVVGYTNAGKTTLIKALTDDESMVPKNQLFATLDVTYHQGILKSKMKVTYIDTVGFISDMPDSLLDAFRATLEDAFMADIVLHIRDASHPDRRLQVLSVHRLFQNLSQENRPTMIEVYNKTDLLTEQEVEDLDPNILNISALTGQGFPELGQQLQQALILATGQMEKVFRIPNNESILRWLQKESAVKSIQPDPKDSQFLIVNVIISDKAYGMMKRKFAKKNSKVS